MSLLIEAVEQGFVPDALVRAGIRQLCRQKLAAARAGGTSARAVRRRELLAAMRDAPIALHTREANAQHYEVPAAFYERVLGPQLKYSCGFWDGARTLAESEERMLALTAERAGLADGQRILELGCGWGSLTLWMARHFPGAHVTAVSNSASQRTFILRRAAAEGLRNLEVLTADMNAFSPPGSARFDRVVSVEMFEHMRNWEALLGRIRRWLTPQGALFVHVFCLRDEPYFFEVDGRSDWMARHFFTGGLMPSEDLLEQCAHGFTLEERWRVDGTHYERTSNAWLAQQDAAAGELRAVLAAVVGQAEAPRALARWRIFHMACAELFGLNGGQDWCVSHARLRPEPVA